MAYAVVRLYENEQQARDAVGKLIGEGFPENSVFLVTPRTGAEEEGAGGPSDFLAAAVMAGKVIGDPGADVYAERVRAGRSMVVVNAEFGLSRPAMEIMDSCGPVDTDIRMPIDPYDWNEGTPLSGTLSLPVLSRDRPTPFSNLIGVTPLVRGQATFGTLTSSTFFPSRVAGGLLTKRAAPFSSLFGLKLLLSARTPWRSSFGIGLLTSKATPFSSLFGMKLLSKNAAPFSSLFGLALLLPENR